MNCDDQRPRFHLLRVDVNINDTQLDTRRIDFLDRNHGDPIFAIILAQRRSKRAIRDTDRGETRENENFNGLTEEGRIIFWFGKRGTYLIFYRRSESLCPF